MCSDVSLLVLGVVVPGLTCVAEFIRGLFLSIIRGGMASVMPTHHSSSLCSPADGRLGCLYIVSGYYE